MSIFGSKQRRERQVAKAIEALAACMPEHQAQPENQIANAKRGCDPVTGPPDS